MTNHSDEDEEDDPAVEDLQSQLEDLDNEASASAGNRENDQPTMLGDLLTMSWNNRKVKLDHDYSIIGWVLSVMELREMSQVKIIKLQNGC